MLDLSILDNSELFEIKLIDGRELTLKRPTQSLQAYLFNLLDEKKQVDDSHMLEYVFSAFTRVLNRNTQGITFSEEELCDEYGIEIAAIVINNYFTYWNNDTASRVDFQ